MVRVVAVSVRVMRMVGVRRVRMVRMVRMVGMVRMVRMVHVLQVGVRRVRMVWMVRTTIATVTRHDLSTVRHFACFLGLAFLGLQRPALATPERALPVVVHALV
jgi:hypothetical protein